MTPTLKGHELAGEYRALDELLAETEGELTPEIEALLADLDGKADEKLERIALVVLRYKHEAEAIKAEEARIAARRKARERSAESLKDYLARTMAQIGKEKVTGLLATVAFQKNPPRVVGDLTASELETLYIAGSDCVTFTPASYALNKRAVLDAHKAEQPIPEGLLIEQSQSLRIR